MSARTGGSRAEPGEGGARGGVRWRQEPGLGRAGRGKGRGGAGRAWPGEGGREGARGGAGPGKAWATRGGTWDRGGVRGWSLPGAGPVEVRAQEEGWDPVLGLDGPFLATVDWEFWGARGKPAEGLVPPPPSLALARPDCPSRMLPPGCISLIRLFNDLMHILAASIKLNQVIMRLSFFGLFFPRRTFLGRGAHLRSLERALGCRGWAAGGRIAAGMLSSGEQ